MGGSFSFARTFVFATALALFAFTAMAAEEETATAFPSSVVGIVDVQRVLQESLAAKSVQGQIETQRAKFQNKIAGEETGLREAEKKLAKLRETAQTEAYAEEEQKLRERFLIVERHVQARRKALDQAFTDAMTKVRESIVSVVKDAAKERNVTLVIVKQQVIWNDRSIDMTDVVLKKLDESMPNIPVKILSDDKNAVFEER